MVLICEKFRHFRTWMLCSKIAWLKLVQCFWRRFNNIVNDFFFLLFHYYLPLKKDLAFHLYKLNLHSLHQWMLCAKLSWNGPSSSEEDENLKSYNDSDFNYMYNTDRQRTHFDPNCSLEYSAQMSLTWKVFRSLEPKWALLIDTWPLSIVVVNISHFCCLLQNHYANFIQTWHKASLGDGNLSLLKWRTKFFFQGEMIAK